MHLLNQLLQFEEVTVACDCNMVSGLFPYNLGSCVSCVLFFQLSNIDIISILRIFWFNMVHFIRTFLIVVLRVQKSALYMELIFPYVHAYVGTCPSLNTVFICLLGSMSAAFFTH